jgi:Holliday junction resolvase RusA-like endonuclease
MNKEKMNKTNKENTKQKIKAIYPHIVVGGDIDKPCYNIHWYDIEQKTMICGFSSYKLELVRKWLEEEFEVVERDIDNLIKSQETEIEKLTLIIDEIEYGYHRLTQEASIIQAETIKELEVKIHEKLHQAEMHGNFEPVVTREMFDSVVKEMGVRVSDNTDK